MIGIVGAGITGLSLGAFLELRGRPCRIWEASDRTGGVIRSTLEEGRVLDHGPQRTRTTPPVRELIEWAAIADEVVEVPPELPVFVYRAGRLRPVPFDFRALLRTDLLSLRGKLRLLLEPLTGGVSVDETVAELLTRKFGGEAYESLLGPLYGGLYGSDPAEMFVRHTLAGTLRGMGVQRSILGHFLRGSFNRAEAPPAVSFRLGMQAWPNALARRLRKRIHLSSPVVEILQIAGGWLVRTQRDEAEVDQLVLTVPAREAAVLLERIAPDASRRLVRLRYNQLALVHLLARGPMNGLGYQVAYGESLRTRGVTWNAAALGRDGVYTAFLGGSRDPGVFDHPEHEIGEIARREFAEVTGCPSEVLSVGRTQVPSWDRSWTAMEGISLPPGLHLCSNYESRVGIPGRVARAKELALGLAVEETGR